MPPTTTAAAAEPAVGAVKAAASSAGALSISPPGERRAKPPSRLTSSTKAPPAASAKTRPAAAASKPAASSGAKADAKRPTAKADAKRADDEAAAVAAVAATATGYGDADGASTNTGPDATAAPASFSSCDKQLENVIRQDILSASCNVHWSDIAGACGARVAVVGSRKHEQARGSETDTQATRHAARRRARRGQAAAEGGCGAAARDTRLLQGPAAPVARRAAVRPAGHRQDHAGQGHRYRVQHDLLQRHGHDARLQVPRRVREAVRCDTSCHRLAG